MEQRIKFIWILSIVCIFLIVGGQGYWLWNQCQYKNEELLKEVRARVLEATALNDSVRDLQPKKIFTDSSSVSWGTSSNRIYHSDSVSGEKKWLYEFEQQVTARMKKQTLFTDTIRFRTSEELGWTMQREVQKYMLQVDVPFTLQRFDSILAVKLPGISFETRFYQVKDSLFITKDSTCLRGSRISPVVDVYYPYNPFGWQMLQVTVRPHLQTLLTRMGWQLLGSLLLVMLLAACFLFQIRTIVKQRRIDELRKSFVNAMIHELKRPVQALKMCVGFLNDKLMRTDEQAMDEVICDSMSELDNLSAYLQKLRDMTRADDKQTQLSLTTFDLKPTIEKLIRLQRIPQDKQVTIETHFTGELLVTADKMHMANIISNLIENAVKYSFTSVSIGIDCVVQHHQLTVTVADNGIGIPVSEQNRVFDKFYRSHALPDHTLPGIGLGLSYVKLLVEAHQGTVSLSSQPGKGTTIIIHIPQ